MVFSLELTFAQMALFLLAWTILGFHLWKQSLIRIETVIGFGPLPLEFFVIVFPIYLILLLWRIAIGGAVFLLLFVPLFILCQTKLEEGRFRSVLFCFNLLCSYALGAFVCWIFQPNQSLMNSITDPWVFLCLVTFLCILITGYSVILVCFHLTVFLAIRSVVELVKSWICPNKDPSKELRPSVSFATLQLFDNLNNPMINFRNISRSLN